MIRAWWAARSPWVDVALWSASQFVALVAFVVLLKTLLVLLPMGASMPFGEAVKTAVGVAWRVLRRLQ